MNKKIFLIFIMLCLVSVQMVFAENIKFGESQDLDLVSIKGYIVELDEKPLIVIDKELKELVKENEIKISEMSNLNPIKYLYKTFATTSEDIPKKLEDHRDKIDSQKESVKKKISDKLGKTITENVISGSESIVVLNDYENSFNGFVLDISEEEAKDIEEIKGVKSVYKNQRVDAVLMDSVPLINADDVWQMQDDFGNNLTGEGMTIAIIDTGIDYTHADLGGCFGINCKVIGGYDFVNNDADPMDDYFHGTHCAGIAAGSGEGGLKGVAPDAKLYAYKVLNSGGSGSFEEVIAGIEAAVDPNDDGNFSDSVDVMSLSLGGSGDPDDPVSTAIDNVVESGVIAVIAAGNSGPSPYSIESPGTARKAITIGATYKKYYNQTPWDSPAQQNQITSFSSRGPVEWENGKIIKPDIVAPGALICSARYDSVFPDGENDYYKPCLDQEHIQIAGTSMATPIVAGAAALLKQKNPDWTPEEIKMALKNSAIDLGEDINTQGFGLLNIEAAISLDKPGIAEIQTTGLVFGTGGEIIGTAKGDSFTSYSLSYKKEYESEWTELCSSNEQKDNEVLCNFDFTILNEGEYLLKLDVYSGTQTSTDYGYIIVKNLVITSIGDNFGYIKGVEEIRGNIYFENYDEYFIEYRNEYSDWSVICSNNEKPSSNLLCNIDVSGFENGAYDFRISVMINNESRLGDSFKAIVFRELLDGWPIEFYGFPYDRINLINDNGEKKIAFKHHLECTTSKTSESSSFNENIIQSTATKPISVLDFNNSYNPNMACWGRALYLYNSDGTLFTYVSSISGKTITYDDSMAVYSKDELEYLAMGPGGDYNYGGLVYPNGEAYKEWSLLDGDSLVVSDDEFFNMGVNYKTGGFFINGFDSDGNYLPNFPININEEPGTNWWFVRMPIVFKDQKDNKNIAMLASNYDYDFSSDYGAANSTIYLDIYSSQDGSLIKRTILYSNLLTKIQASPIYMVAGDVNNDGRTEIIVGMGILDLILFRENYYNLDAYLSYFYVIDDLGNIIAQSNEIKGFMPIQLALAKSSDSGLLIVATLHDTWPTTYEGQRIMVFDDSLNVNVDVNLEDYNDLIQRMTIGDVDSDEESEIVVNYRPRWWNEGSSGIHIFNLDGTYVKEIEIPTTDHADDYYSRYPILTDFDNDGNLDIIQQSLLLEKKGGEYISYARIYAYTLGQTYNESNIEWQMFLRNPQHTALYNKILRPISRLKNNNFYPITGNLILALQQYIGGIWTAKEVMFEQEINLPAQTSIDISNYWNSQNISRSEDGNYRVYGSFYVVGEELIENTWDFVVEGEVGNISICGNGICELDETLESCPIDCNISISCYSDEDCPDETNYYCSIDNSSCSSTTLFTCFNSGTPEADCVGTGGGGGCTKPCPFGCDEITGKCIGGESNESVSPLLRFFQ